MIDSLYSTFQEWTRNGSVWILSDPHFGDSDCQLMDPNWISPEEQIRRINEKCGKNDTFICLGDVGDIEYIKKLNARHKILIKGNHDKGDSYYLRNLTFFEKTVSTEEDLEYAKELIKNNRFNKNSRTMNTSWTHTRTNGEVIQHLRVQMDNSLFDEVYSGPLFISDKIVLSHSPLNFGDESSCFFNIHGHEHNLVYRQNHLNVAANVIGYCPLNLGEIIKSGMLANIDNINKFVTAKAVERKNNEI